MALLLFAFVCYGATVEVVHKHSSLVKKLDEAASSIGGVNREGTAANDSRQSGACLICQLHQNLFTSLFNAQPRLVMPLTPIEHTTTEAASYLSQMDAPRRGRAPPLASLL
jgi:hypothetical protein